MPTKPLRRTIARCPFRSPKRPLDATAQRATQFGREYFTDEQYSYPEWHQDQSSEVVSHILYHLRPPKHWVFLDVGCALGGMVEALRRRGYEAYGVDISHWCLRNSTVRRYLRFGSITNLPCRDQSVDAILCFDTFQYLTREESRRAAAELRRVTRHSLCFEGITWEDRKHSDTSENPDRLRKSRSLYEREELIDLFDDAGFSLWQRSFLPRSIEGNWLGHGWYNYEFSFNAIFEVDS